MYFVQNKLLINITEQYNIYWNIMRAHYIRERKLALTNDLAGQQRQCRRSLV